MTDKQALRDIASAAVSTPLWHAVGIFGEVVDPAKPEWKPVHDFCKIFTAERVLALLDELEAKDSSISTQQHEIRTLLNALEQATEKRNSDLPDQKRIIGWRASDYTDETSDPELAKNWAAAIGVLPIFEGDVNTKLSAAAAGKGE
ncbi:hypothetical protein ACE3LM_22555 [Enterobacter hormaechei subsp. steigerwaltii]